MYFREDQFQLGAGLFPVEVRFSIRPEPRPPLLSGPPISAWRACGPCAPPGHVRQTSPARAVQETACSQSPQAYFQTCRQVTIISDSWALKCSIVDVSKLSFLNAIMSSNKIHLHLKNVMLNSLSRQFCLHWQFCLFSVSLSFICSVEVV